ncbi:MAG: hypothetical protein U0892_04210 [Pirellulales bacterium]
MHGIRSVHSIDIVLPLRRLLLVFVLSAVALPSAVLHAQHCAPIVESYLSTTELKRSADGLEFDLAYSKTGGQRKDAYQAYLLVFKESDAERVLAMTPQQAIEAKLAVVAHTQVIRSGEDGSYALKWKLDNAVFVKNIVEEGKLSHERVVDNGGWKKFQDTLRIAVFIPFLDDKTYAIADGLPEYKHECNYLSDPALLFDPLPQRFTIHFGVVQGFRQAEGHYTIQVNGKRR